MFYLTKNLITVLIVFVMQTSVAGMTATTPMETAEHFMQGISTQEQDVMEQYMSDRYVNFLMNLQGDEDVTERMNKALFANFSYRIEKLAEKDNVAVARVTVSNCDFSGVKKAYDRASYRYVMDNLYKEETGDKDRLNAKCLEIYVEQIEKAAEEGDATERVIYLPMMDNGYHGWNIIMSDEIMKEILGGFEIPEKV